jgi:hypothetical protein
MDGGVSQALLSTMVTHYSYFFIVHAPPPLGTTGDRREEKAEERRGPIDSPRGGGGASLEQEKGDKSETTKQLTGEYKDFYRTLRKVPGLTSSALMPSIWHLLIIPIPIRILVRILVVAVSVAASVPVL